MKKLLTLLLSAVILTGCSTKPAEPIETSAPNETFATDEAATEVLEETGLSVLAPYGAPSLSLIPVIKDDLATVTTVSGPDPLMAGFVQPDSEYDVIIAATNLGVKLHDKGKSPYKLLDVVSWGNLYVVAEDENALNEAGEMACFGEMATPGLVFKKLFTEVTPNVTWYASVADARAALLSGNANCALLAQPAAAATIAKGKEQGKDFKIIANLQEMWGDGEGYPQAGIFVNEDRYNENSEPYDNLVKYMKDYMGKDFDASAVVADVEKCNPEVFGLQKAGIVGKTYQDMGLKIVPAKDCEEEIKTFLDVFGIEGVDEAIVK